VTVTETERRRLVALADYAALEPLPPGGLKSACRVVAHFLDVPVCLIGFIDERSVRVVSGIGVEGPELPRAWTTALVQRGRVVSVTRSTHPDRFGPAVGPVRSWAAAPLRTASGLVVGVILAADRRSRPFTPNQEAVLSAMADLLMAELDVRRRRHEEGPSSVLQSVERHFESLLRDASDTIAVIDANGELAYTSPALLRLLGYGEGHALPAARLHPDDLPLVAGSVTVALARPGVTGPVEFRLVHGDGTYHTFEAVLANNMDDPSVGGVVVYLRDISDRHRATALLSAEAKILELIARGEPVDTVLAAAVELLESGARGGRAVIRRYRPETRSFELACAPNLPESFISVIRHVPVPGWPFEGTAVLDLAAADDIDPALRAAASAHRLATVWTRPVTAGESGRLLGSVGMYLADARAPEPEDERVLETAAGLVGLALQRLDLADGPGGVVPRTELVRRLDDVLTRAAGGRGKAAVLLLDLDRFKEINEGLGHEGGDRVLPLVTRRLAEVVRPTDLVARVAGDEFVVVCEGLIGELEAVGVAERINAALREPVRVDRSELHLTASIGIAMTHGEGDHAEALLRDADAALYQAKQRGRARFELFNEARRREARARRALEGELERAIEEGELRVWLQPEIELATGRLMGFEALVRWQHPERGLLAPATFIPQAERSGLIDRLGEWVLLESCRLGRTMRDGAEGAEAAPLGVGPVVAVNLSARQLGDPLLADRVAAALSAAGLSPADLCLELTESALMEDADLSLHALRALRALGVRLAIDDFGTGYSSLAYLRRFPIDSVKIDRSFVAGLGSRLEDRAIVSAVLDLTRALGLSAIAEGVEQAGQRDELVRLGCEAAQGYFFSPPRPAHELIG
jgi:diguanylate cyclase (GGDEF)-like protein/PAS domain S-box-containing protein